MIKLHRKKVRMTGINDEIPSKLVFFSGAYQARAQGVAIPGHEQLKPLPILSRFLASFEMLGRFLVGRKI